MRRILLGAVCLLALAWVVPAAAADQTPPTAAIDGSPVLTPDSIVSVVGSDWPEHTVVLVELCGNSGANTSDCDRPRSRTLGVGSAGTFTAPITASVPPSPCPCVVRVTSMSSSARFAIPVEVVGAPVAQVIDPLAPRAENSLRIDSIHLESTRSLGEWFGSSPQRELTFQVTNTSDEVLYSVPVEVLVGSDAEAGRQVDIEPIESLEPGATTTVSTTVGFDPLTIGRAELFGAVGRDNWRAMFEADTHSFPWGLVVVLLLVLQVGLVLGRNAVRRRLSPQFASISPVVALPASSAFQDTVIDLRDDVASLPWPRAALVAAPPEREPDRTLRAILEVVDGLRARYPAPAGTMAVVVVASAGDGGGAVVRVRTAPFTAPGAGAPWVAMEGIEAESDLAESRALSPNLIDALTGGRPIVVDVDDDIERSLVSIGAMISAQLLSLRSAGSARAVAAAVALSASASEVTHLVVVELPPGGVDDSTVVLRSLPTG